MEQLQSDLTSRGLDSSLLSPELKSFILRAEVIYKDLPEKRRAEFVEKFIDILADAENNLSQLKTEVGIRTFLNRTEDTANMMRTGIETKEVYELRMKLYKEAGLDQNPSKNGTMSQILMATIDEFIIGMGDMAFELYKVIDEKGAGYILSQLKDTILSGEVWKAVGHEIGDGLSDLFLNWNTDNDDFIYKKTRQVLITLGIGVLLKSVGKKIIKSLVKRTVASTAKAAV